MTIEKQNIKDNELLSEAAALASVPDGIISLAMSIAFRCALVAKTSCGAASANGLVSLAARMRQLALSSHDNAVSSFGTSVAATFYAASLNSRKRSSGVAVVADSRLLCDIEECAYAFDSIRLNGSFRKTRQWCICFEAQSIAAVAYETAFSVVPGSLSLDERRLSPLRGYALCAKK